MGLPAATGVVETSSVCSVNPAGDDFDSVRSEIFGKSGFLLFGCCAKLGKGQTGNG